MALELAVQKRDRFGKKVNALRKEGFIPAELYGHGVENLHLSVSEKEFNKVYNEAGESTLISVVVEGNKVPVMIHDVAVDPVSDEVRHVDFYQVRLDEKISVAVPLIFVGESPAVKAGGVLVKAMHEIELEALPNQLPHDIHVDLTRLAAIGESIYVKDLAVPEGVTFDPAPETVVASVTEKEEEEEAPAAPVDVSAIKTEGEEKRQEKAAEKATEEGEEKK